MTSLKCLLAAVAVAGIWVSVASADMVQTWNSSDQNMQGRSGQYGGGNQLTTAVPGANTSFMTIGQKGSSITSSNTTTVNSTLSVVLNQHDAFGRHVLRWNMAGLPEPVAGADGLMSFMFDRNPPGGYTPVNTGVVIQLYSISQANGDWLDTGAKWQAKNISTNTAWTGSGGVGALVPGDLAYGDGSYALGAPGGGGYAATPFATFTCDQQDYATGNVFNFTVPYAVLEQWWQADNGVVGAGLNAGILIRLDATSEAENGTYGPLNYIKQIEFVASDSTYTDAVRTGAWGHNGRPMLTYNPEPSTLSLLALGGLAMLRRRR